MRIGSLVFVLAAACGGGSGQVTPDATPLPGCVPVNGRTVSLRKVATIPGAPLLVTSPPNDGRLFVVDRAGYIRVLEQEQLKETPFLDVHTLIATDDQEQGLLGLAFSPNYATNRELYIYYTTSTLDIVARYHQSKTDPNVAETDGEAIISIPDYAGNHNGGMLEFGSDGYLYVSTGDGGKGGDPCRNGQALKRGASCPDLAGTQQEPWLGKILRLDVSGIDAHKMYKIPPTNPYANDIVTGEPEIFMRGLRNPWRWSFDRANGDMYIGDVGQDAVEEIDVLTPDQQAGANLGWSLYEGNDPYNGSDPAGLLMPQLTRTHSGDGWYAIIGGQVYRGTCFPDLAGDYFFTDYAHGGLDRARFENGSLSSEELPGSWPDKPTSIHADARGELFLTAENGDLYTIEAGP